jgi:pyridoxamine 5'-phosphate oxidase
VSDDADRFARLREEYAGEPLDEATASGDPIEQFERWFEEAVAAGVGIANGMVLATVGGDGQPSARVVLLKSFDHRGFVFFSNYDSRKGRDLEANPRASVVFWWQPLARQVRVEGRVMRTSEAESDAYFATRPREANLGAMASRQSRVVSDRAELEGEVTRAAGAWDGRALERPAHWGGYRLLPRSLEFWQGRPDRLHDRLRYSLGEDLVWRIERLAP